VEGVKHRIGKRKARHFGGLFLLPGLGLSLRGCRLRPGDRRVFDRVALGAWRKFIGIEQKHGADDCRERNGREKDPYCVSWRALPGLRFRSRFGALAAILLHRISFRIQVEQKTLPCWPSSLAGNRDFDEWLCRKH